MKVKGQETGLTLQEHDDDDDDVNLYTYIDKTTGLLHLKNKKNPAKVRKLIISTHFILHLSVRFKSTIKIQFKMAAL